MGDWEAAGSQNKTGRLIPDDVWGILCVFAEARGEPYEGQVAVGNVVRHRTKRQFFSNGTVVSTVFMPYQFSWANQGDAQRTRVLSASWDDPSIKTAAKAWYASEYEDVVPEATHYHADYISPQWAKANRMVFVKRIGRHVFYREDTVA